MRTDNAASAFKVMLDLPFAQVLRQACLLKSAQMLGAMEWAFTRSVEYALNLRTRRLMALHNEYGSVPFWRRILGEAFINDSRETL